MAVAAVALGRWRQSEPRPRARAAALVVALAGGAAFAYAAVPVLQMYPVYQFTTFLAPASPDISHYLCLVEPRWATVG
jgi:hypothetical protein